MDLQLDEGVVRAVQDLPPGLGPLEAGTRLRRTLDPERARAAAELYALRLRARRKLPAARFLTRKGLEQASDHRVAAARARRIQTWRADAWVLDATCGIGGDALALVEAGLRVVAADRDVRHAALARANLLSRSDRAWVVRAAAENPPVSADCLVLDPDRRAHPERGRSSRPTLASPSWNSILELLPRFRASCVKLAPAAEVDTLEPDLPDRLAHVWQWVSLEGELKELVLWTGELADTWRDGATGTRPGARAVLALDGSGREQAWRAEPTQVTALDPERARSVRWIAEPDPAVIRAGLVGTLASLDGLAPLAPGIAYLGGDDRPTSPLLRAYEVLGESPLDPRRVRQLLAEHGIGPLTVKKRGHPDDAGTLAARLRGKGSEPGLLLVSRLERGHHAFLVGARAG